MTEIQKVLEDQDTRLSQQEKAGLKGLAERVSKPEGIALKTTLKAEIEWRQDFKDTMDKLSSIIKETADPAQRLTKAKEFLWNNWMDSEGLALVQLFLSLNWVQTWIDGDIGPTTIAKIDQYLNSMGTAPAPVVEKSVVKAADAKLETKINPSAVGTFIDAELAKLSPSLHMTSQEGIGGGKNITAVFEVSGIKWTKFSLEYNPETQKVIDNSSLKLLQRTVALLEGKVDFSQIKHMQYVSPKKDWSFDQLQFTTKEWTQFSRTKDDIHILDSKGNLSWAPLPTKEVAAAPAVVEATPATPADALVLGWSVESTEATLNAKVKAFGDQITAKFPSAVLDVKWGSEGRLVFAPNWNPRAVVDNSFQSKLNDQWELVVKSAWMKDFISPAEYLNSVTPFVTFFDMSHKLDKTSPNYANWLQNIITYIESNPALDWLKWGVVNNLMANVVDKWWSSGAATYDTLKPYLPLMEQSAQKVDAAWDTLARYYIATSNPRAEEMAKEYVARETWTPTDPNSQKAHNFTLANQILKGELKKTS